MIKSISKRNIFNNKSMIKSIYKVMFLFTILSLQSCIGCSDQSRYDYDENYWNSIEREQALKDAGLGNAAKIERNSRLNYLKGGGYTSPDGGRQIHFNGSKEQQEQLRKMDELGW